MAKKKAVKYFRQATFYSCGPACLRMMLPAFGLDATESELINICGTSSFGTTCEQILEAAQLVGLTGETFKIRTIAELDGILKKRLPIIALIDAAVLYGGPPLSGHFVVVLKTKSDEIVYHDPAMGPNRTVAIGLFLKAWQVFNLRGVRLWKPRESAKK
ncbi:C39 family peptidase [candidate division KSB1 bacterium]|nr:C39 family peptidase [candidate division KSB1 bacterium]